MVKQLILINGAPSTGKTTISKILLDSLKSGAWVDTDDLMHTRPWQPTEELYFLALTNAVAAGKNFYESGFNTVIISGCVHSNDLFNFLYKNFDKDIFGLYVQLVTNEQERSERLKIRKNGQSEAKGNALLTSVDVKPFSFVSIDTSINSPEGVVSVIQSNLK